MPVWLVTGASGFLGRSLLEALRGEDREGVEVVAIGRRPPPFGLVDSFEEVDLGDPSRLAQVLGKLGPSRAFHLAGRTPPAPSAEFYRSNTMATVHLLDALRGAGRTCRVVMAGSAAELGPVPVEDLPVGEDYPCRPADAYGLSKWLATAAGLASRPPVEVCVARVFNPIGPGSSSTQALGRFAEALAMGVGPVRLSVGNLETRRDFVDVRDVANALIAIESGGRPGRVYHVGTGRSQRVRDGLDRLIGLSGREVTLEVDSGRALGPLDSRADVSRVAAEVGWAARIPWERSVDDLWAGAVARVRAGLTDPPAPV